MSEVKAERMFVRLCATIRECRLALELSEEELGEAIGKNADYVQKLEKGELQFGLDVLRKCAQAFSLSMSEFLELADENHELVLFCEE